MSTNLTAIYGINRTPFSSGRWYSQTFTTSGTFIKPENVDVVNVLLVGGGGGGHVGGGNLKLSTIYAIPSANGGESIFHLPNQPIYAPGGYGGFQGGSGGGSIAAKSNGDCIPGGNSGPFLSGSTKLTCNGEDILGFGKGGIGFSTSGTSGNNGGGGSFGNGGNGTVMLLTNSYQGMIPSTIVSTPATNGIYGGGGGGGDYGTSGGADLYIGSSTGGGGGAIIQRQVPITTNVNITIGQGGTYGRWKTEAELRATPGANNNIPGVPLETEKLPGNGGSGICIVYWFK